MNVNWDKRWLDLTNHVASWSKDRSRGVGAVIVGNRKEVLSLGYNGFPRGVDDDVECRHERPIKYVFTEHAERNAIYNAAANGVSLVGSTLYVSLFPCCDCTRGVIQSGVKRVVTFEPDWFADINKQYHFQEAMEMYYEAKVEVDFYNDDA